MPHQEINQKVRIGNRVLVLINGQQKELMIIDGPKGDPNQGTISCLSPLAQALLGCGCSE